MRKKLLSCITLFSVAVSLVCSTGAVSQSNFTETQGENYSVTRTLKRTPTTTYSLTPDYSGIKADLLMLGMDQQDIDNLSNEHLARFDSSDEISTVVSYVRMDKDGTKTYVPEEEALAAVAASSDVPTEDDTYVYNESGYLRVYHQVSHEGGASYHFLSAARWLTMPSFRLTDALGSAQSYCTVHPGTETGVYSYHVTTYSSIGIKTGEYDVTDEPITSMDDAVSGVFYGMAGFFNLPGDEITGEGVVTKQISNFNARFEYDGYIQNEDATQTFNSTGSYIHTFITPTISPNLTIDGNGGSPSLGMGLAANEERTEAKLIIRYIAP